MARKRGGLAGLYDRNKKIIKAAAPFAAGFIPGVGPMVAAGLGAAMGGLDREGKSGIGLDLGGAVKGGISGYGSGKLGQGLKKMFTTQMANRSASAALGKMPAMGIRPDALTQTVGGANPYGAVGSFQPTMAAGSAPSTGMFASQASSNAAELGKTASKMSGGAPRASMTAGRSAAGPSVAAPKAPASQRSWSDFLEEEKSGNKFADAAKKTGGFIERNQQAIGGAAKGIAGVLGSRAEGEAAAGNLELAQSRFDYEKQQDTQAQEKRRRLAQMMGQMFAPQMANVSPSGRGNPAMTMQDYMDSTGSAIPPEGFGPDMMEYIESGRGPVRPSGPNPELMEYVGRGRGPVRPSGPNPELMQYVNSRRR